MDAEGSQTVGAPTVDVPPEGRQEFLQYASTRAATDPVIISIRDLIAKWGAKRRGYTYVDWINEDLRKHRLTTSPSFADEYWIDSRVRLVADTEGQDQPELAGDARRDVTTSAAVPQENPTPLGANRLRVRTLMPSSDLVSVRPTDSLDKACGIMLRHDYSQLAVISDARTLKGAITWESIAQARLVNPKCGLPDCIVSAEIVGADDELLTHVARVIEHNFIFVRHVDNTLAGIITTSDLSAKFASLTGPFLLVGELERSLREIVKTKFTEAEIREAKDERDETRNVNGPEDLTFGELLRLFEPRERWDAHGWPFDRSIFLQALTDARDLRNEVMHFSPDDIEEDRLRNCRNLLKWLHLVSK